MKKFRLLSLFVLLLSGCVSTVYRGETFPATNDLQIITAPVPVDYRVIGRGKAQGEYSGTSNLELENKLRELGLAHGAEAMIIAGTMVVPDGKAVNDANENFIEATDDPDQVEFETFMQEALNPSSDGGSNRFLRVMYAVFLRRKP